MILQDFWLFLFYLFINHLYIRHLGRLVTVNVMYTPLFDQNIIIVILYIILNQLIWFCKQFRAALYLFIALIFFPVDWGNIRNIRLFTNDFRLKHVSWKFVTLHLFLMTLLIGLHIMTFLICFLRAFFDWFDIGCCFSSICLFLCTIQPHIHPPNFNQRRKRLRLIVCLKLDYLNFIRFIWSLTIFLLRNLWFSLISICSISLYLFLYFLFIFLFLLLSFSLYRGGSPIIIEQRRIIIVRWAMLRMVGPWMCLWLFKQWAWFWSLWFFWYFRVFTSWLLERRLLWLFFHLLNYILGLLIFMQRM